MTTINAKDSRHFCFNTDCKAPIFALCEPRFEETNVVYCRDCMDIMHSIAGM